MRSVQRSQFKECWVVILCAIIIRLFFIPFSSFDFLVYSHWYDYILNHGQWQALAHRFSDYNMPYLYLLTLLTYVPINKAIGIKFFSIFFDFVLASGVFLIVWEKYRLFKWPFLAATLILFLPTVVINSAIWGQCDVIYAAFVIYSLWFILKNKFKLAVLFLGIAFSFKIQTIFFLPILGLLIIKRKMSVFLLLAIPAIYIILDLPVYFLGMSFYDILTVYIYQSSETYLVHGAPNFYIFVNNPLFSSWIVPAILLTLIVTLFSLARLSLQAYSNLLVIKSALFFTLLLPFFLPNMHERYFYLAEMISIIWVFYQPRYFFIPMLLQLISIVTYSNYLFRVGESFFTLTPFVMLVCLLTVGYSLFFEKEAQSYIRSP